MHTGFVTAITFFLEDFTGGMGTNTQIRYPDRKKNNNSNLILRREI